MMKICALGKLPDVLFCPHLELSDSHPVEINPAQKLKINPAHCFEKSK